LAAVVLGSFTQYVVGSPHLDITQGYLLFRPIGYANALGGLIAIGIPLFLGFAVADTRRVVQEGAAAMCVVSTAALYLTQNRSGWIALSVALVVWLLRTSARLEVATTILLTAIPAAAAVAVLRHLDLLDTNAGGTSRPDRVLLAAGAVAGLAAVAAVGIRARPHVRVGPRAVASGILVGALGAAASLALAVAHVGDRGHYWRVAWRETERQWLLGAGAGTFEELWFQYRDVTRVVRDAHNLYLETLSELGVVGLLLLMLLLLSPLVVARSSRDSLIAAVRGGYCGFLVHAAFEWDWEMPVVTVSALTLGVALLLSRPEAPPFQLRRPARIAAAVVLGVLALFAVGALAGNSYLVTAERRSRAGDPGAETRAVRATHLIPWASEPWLVIADSRARRGDLAGSREALLAAISRDDHDWAVWYRLAVASQAATRARAIEQAVTLNPRLVRGP
jgi:O-antigen ligase